MGFDNILVEGPDGSGKSTFLQHLKSSPMFSHLSLRDPWPWVPSTGPTSLVGLTALVTDDAAQKGKRLYDRHPLTSQPIYGRMLHSQAPRPLDHTNTPPQTQPPGWFHPNGTPSAWYVHMLTALANRTLLVVCLPPLDVVKKNLDKSSTQMPGVTEHVYELWSAYHGLPCLWPGASIRYDYTTDNRLFKTRLMWRLLNDA